MTLIDFRKRLTQARAENNPIIEWHMLFNDYMELRKDTLDGQWLDLNKYGTNEYLKGKTREEINEILKEFVREETTRLKEDREFQGELEGTKIYISQNEYLVFEK